MDIYTTIDAEGTIKSIHKTHKDAMNFAADGHTAHAMPLPESEAIIGRKVDTLTSTVVEDPAPDFTATATASIISHERHDIELLDLLRQKTGIDAIVLTQLAHTMSESAARDKVESARGNTLALKGVLDSRARRREVLHAVVGRPADKSNLALTAISKQQVNEIETLIDSLAPDEVDALEAHFNAGQHFTADGTRIELPTREQLALAAPDSGEA